MCSINVFINGSVFTELSLSVIMATGLIANDDV